MKIIHSIKIFTIIFLIISIQYSSYSYDSSTRENFLETIKKSKKIQKEILLISANTLIKLVKEDQIYHAPDKGSWILWEKSGVFVTLEKYGKPRGCRGTLFPVCPTVAEEIINSTIGAATRDKRYPPIEKEELNKLLITVTVVGDICQIPSINEADPLIHGIMVQTINGEKKGVMLPGEGPDMEKMLLWAKKRGGIRSEEEVIIYCFTGVRFSGNIKELLKIQN